MTKCKRNKEIRKKNMYIYVHHKETLPMDKKNLINIPFCYIY